MFDYTKVGVTLASSIPYIVEETVIINKFRFSVDLLIFVSDMARRSLFRW